MNANISTAEEWIEASAMLLKTSQTLFKDEADILAGKIINLDCALHSYHDQFGEKADAVAHALFDKLKLYIRHLTKKAEANIELLDAPHRRLEIERAFNDGKKSDVATHLALLVIANPHAVDLEMRGLNLKVPYDQLNQQWARLRRITSEVLFELGQQLFRDPLLMTREKDRATVIPLAVEAAARTLRLKKSSVESSTLATCTRT